jgi:hypothetical protein
MGVVWTAGYALQPVAEHSCFLLDEFLVAEGICQGRNALTPGEKVHRQRVGVCLTAEQRELPA